MERAAITEGFSFIMKIAELVWLAMEDCLLALWTGLGRFSWMIFCTMDILCLARFWPIIQSIESEISVYNRVTQLLHYI